MAWRDKRYDQRVEAFHNEARMTEGPGLTRAAEHEKTKEVELVVRQPGHQPMKVVMRASSKTKACQYLLNRWPSAEVRAL